MKTVIDTVKCKNCGGVARREQRFQTGERFVACHRCGHEDNWTFYPELRGGTDWADSNTEVVHVLGDVWVNGCGVMRIYREDGTESLCGIGGSVSDGDIPMDFLQHVLSQEGVDRSKSYITEWKDGKVELLLGERLPKEALCDYEEWDNRGK